MNCISPSGSIKRLTAVAVLSLMALTGCGGDDGAPGPPGLPAGIDIGNAAEINAFIDRVTIASPTVVDFTLMDGNGNPIKNLPAGSISFKLAKLVPGTDGNASAWQSYINEMEQPGAGPGTEAKTQAATENGSLGTLVDNQDGTYRYTFSFDIATVTTPISVSYQPTLTHRVTFEIRGFAPVRNPFFDIRPSDNATAGLFTREIANIALCNNCHENLAFHGGARFEMQDCVTCHNPGSADANSGNTVDMTVMAHKIHHGVDLPTIVNGAVGDRYSIFGFNDAEHIYSINTAPLETEGVVHPQDIRNCGNCHDENNPETPDASNWYTMPTDAACGSCHDDVNFVTGANHGNPPPIPATNDQCISCHATNPNSAIEVRQAHRMLAVERAANYEYNILSIDFTVAGTAPAVTFSITDPQNNDLPYDLANDPELTASPIRFNVGWNTVDYSNANNTNDNAQPNTTNIYSGGALDPSVTINGDGTYSMPLSMVALGATGSGVVNFEGRVATTDGNAPVTTSFKYFIVDDPMNPVPRRVSADIDRCNDCHALTSQHGSRDNDSIEACQVCHIADAARRGTPSNGPMDMKHFLHRKHAVDIDVRYPQRTSNCIACHTDNGFYPVASDSGVLATSINRGDPGAPAPDPADPTDNNRISPNTAACGTCHSSADANVHMVQNGGSLDACQEADGTTREKLDFCGTGGNKAGALVIESCGVCHGAGRNADVATAHRLDL